MTASPDGDAVVVARGVGKRYGGRAVLDAVDLEIARGELVALLGPNGAGKTTLVEILEGYRRADGGAIRVLGRDPWRAGRDHRARVGVMLQSGGFDPRARPRELLRLHAAFFADPRPPDEVLGLVGLEAVARTPFRRLSGGERQRLSLGVALLGRPELLVLDEPTAGMDPAARAATRSLVAELRSAGTTILLTTHDLGDVERLADRVAILHRGHVVALASPGEIAGGGRARLRVRLEPAAGATALSAHETRLGRGRVEPEPARGPGWIAVEGTALDPALVAEVAAWAAEARVLIAELRAGGGTLEERYLELTGDGDVARDGTSEAGT